MYQTLFHGVSLFSRGTDKHVSVCICQEESLVKPTKRVVFCNAYCVRLYVHALYIMYIPHESACLHWPFPYFLRWFDAYQQRIFTAFKYTEIDKRLRLNNVDIQGYIVAY